MSLTHRLRFLERYMRAPQSVGALAPSSRALAVALCEPFRRRSRPSRMLEVGAGTGAITRHIGGLLGEQDELDICEIQEDFADILEKEVLSSADFAGAVARRRVRLLRGPVQEFVHQNRYDFVISGLPLTGFPLEELQDVLTTIRASLRPGGVLSYFEYAGLRLASRLFAVGDKRKRIRRVSDYLSENIRNHQFDRRMVLRNFPPAHARHLCFDRKTVSGRLQGKKE